MLTARQKLEDTRRRHRKQRNILDQKPSESSAPMPMSKKSEPKKVAAKPGKKKVA